MRITSFSRFKFNALSALLFVGVILLFIFNLDAFKLYVNLYTLSRSSRVQLTQKIKRIPQGDDQVYLDQSWILPNITVITTFDQLNNTERYIIGDFGYSPGLGNLMFQYAALKAIATVHRAKVVIPQECTLRRAFQLDAIFVSNKLYNQLIKRFYAHKHEFWVCCKYYPESLDRLLFKDRNFELFLGYMQSFRYFHPHQEELIRNQFTFLPTIVQRADNYLDEAKHNRLKAVRDQADTINAPHDAERFTYVGVHVRHGNDLILNENNMKHGHTVVSKKYIENAMNYFRSNFKNIIFIISSDNHAWVTMNIKSTRKGEIYQLLSGQREIDMATLTRCNHTIMSTGTFSWWAGYLTNGITIYSSDWPKIGSDLEKMVQKTDFFPKNWIPMH